MFSGGTSSPVPIFTGVEGCWLALNLWQGAETRTPFHDKSLLPFEVGTLRKASQIRTPQPHQPPRPTPHDEKLKHSRITEGWDQRLFPAGGSSEAVVVLKPGPCIIWGQKRFINKILRQKPVLP